MQSEIKDILATWSSRSEQIRDCFPNESALPRELRSWLRRLTYFQRLTGSEIRIPASLMKLLEGPRREIREREHLAKLEENGQLNHKQACRLKSLRSKPSNQEKFDRKAILLAMELCVLSAIESLRTLLMNPVQNRWIEMSGKKMPSDWSDQRCIAYADWVEEMMPAQKLSLIHI